MDVVAEDDNNNDESTVADAEAEAETLVVDVIVGFFIIVDILRLEAADDLLGDEMVEEVDDFNEACLSRFNFRS